MSRKLPGERGRVNATNNQAPCGMTTRSRSRDLLASSTRSGGPTGLPSASAGVHHGPLGNLHSGVKRGPPRGPESPTKRGPASPPPPPSRGTTPSPTTGQPPRLLRGAHQANLNYSSTQTDTPSKKVTEDLAKCSIGQQGPPSRRRLFQDGHGRMIETTKARGPETHSGGPAVTSSYAALPQSQSTSSAGRVTRSQSAHSEGQPVKSSLVRETQQPTTPSRGQQSTGIVQQRYNISKNAVSCYY